MKEKWIESLNNNNKKTIKKNKITYSCAFHSVMLIETNSKHNHWMRFDIKEL